MGTVRKYGFTPTRLLTDTKRAAMELGIDASGPLEFNTLENTPKVHNLIVCTLCSCYPRAILGRPPDWYKSFAYRSRAVVEPRTVMGEFGLEIPNEVEIAVHDSSADIRYMILPMRPPSTEHLSEEELAQLITRDSLIGVDVPRYQGKQAVYKKVNKEAIMKHQAGEVGQRSNQWEAR